MAIVAGGPRTDLPSSNALTAGNRSCLSRVAAFFSRERTSPATGKIACLFWLTGAEPADRGSRSRSNWEREKPWKRLDTLRRGRVSCHPNLLRLTEPRAAGSSHGSIGDAPRICGSEHASRRGLQEEDDRRDGFPGRSLAVDGEDFAGQRHAVEEQAADVLVARPGDVAQFGPVMHDLDREGIMGVGRLGAEGQLRPHCQGGQMVGAIVIPEPRNSEVVHQDLARGPVCGRLRVASGRFRPVEGCAFRGRSEPATGPARGVEGELGARQHGDRNERRRRQFPEKGAPGIHPCFVLHGGSIAEGVGHLWGEGEERDKVEG